MDSLPREGGEGPDEVENPPIAQCSDGAAANDSQPQRNPSPPLRTQPAPGGSKLEENEQQAASTGMARGGSPPAAGSPPQAIVELPAGLPGELPPGPRYKRGRGRSFFKEVKKGSVCQVPGCDRSLHKLRDYYKRYKICPYHLELPCLVVEGQSIRFCQQCGRYQLLSDFEGDRRSCVRKLTKHNERRRRAEALRARMLEDGEGSDDDGDPYLSDSPQSTHATKAARPSPREPAAPVPGPSGGALAARLRQLSGVPLLASLLSPQPPPDGVAPASNGASSSQAQRPGPPQPPGLPPNLLSLLPLEVQQQVLQYGPGVLDGALLRQLLALQPTVAPAPLPPTVALQAAAAPRPPGLGLPLGTQQRVQHVSPGAQGAAPLLPQLDPALAAVLNPALLGAPLQQQQQQQQQLQAGQPPAPSWVPPLAQARPSLPPQAQLPPPQAQLVAPQPQALAPLLATPSASMLLQHLQQQQQQEQQRALAVATDGGVAQLAVPSPAAPAAGGSSAPPSAPNKAALLLALARYAGVTGEDLAQALQQHKGALAPAAASAPAAPSAAAPPAASAFAAAASTAALPPPPSTAGQPAQSRGGLDVAQMQQAVLAGALPRDVSEDASLLLQLVAAAEQAHKAAAQAGDRMHFLSLKLFKTTPDQLPRNVLDQLEGWLAQNRTLLDGGARPGCVHLSVSALLSPPEAAQLAADLAGAVQRLAATVLHGLPAGMLAQLGSQAVLADPAGRCLARLDLRGSGAAPRIASVRPLAVTPDYRGPLLVTGTLVGAPGSTIYCRSGAAFPTVEVLAVGALLEGGGGGPGGPGTGHGWALLRIPALSPGCLSFEAQHGDLVSPPAAVLVLEDAAAAGELRQLELPGGSASPDDVSELLHRLGAVLRFARSWEEGSAGAALTARVRAVAQELAALCILRRWGAVLRLLLPATALGCAAAEAVAAVEANLGGVPLLHVAVAIGGAGVVRALGAWAAAAALPLPLDARLGGGRLTPLHLAALLEDGADVAAALAELDPAGAPTAWAAAAAATGSGDTALGLACRLRRRPLLCMLRSAGVPGAAAMLAALDAGEEGAAAASVLLPPTVDDAAGEVDGWRRLWTRLFRSFLAKEQPLPPTEGEGAAAAAKRSWPPRCGTESPSSVLQLLDRPSPSAAAPAAGAPEGSRLGPSAAALPDAPCKAAGGCGMASDFSAGTGLEAAGAAAGLQPACFKRSMVDRRRHPQAILLRQGECGALCALGLLLPFLLAVLPSSKQAALQAWLLQAVANAPLTFQPLLLACPPLQAAYRRCRPGRLLALHLALFALHLWLKHTHGTDWLAANALLASRPAGLWLLACVWALQMRFAVQTPPLLAAYAAHLCLLPLGWRHADAPVCPLR